MDEYVNVVLLSEGWPEASRANAASPVKRFYSTNGSPLFGDFRVSNQTPAVPPSPLNAEDIRRMLKALALVTRLPLLFVWQRGMKINSVLTLTWAVVKESSPLKLQFYGRKRHRKPYRTFIGRD